MLEHFRTVTTDVGYLLELLRWRNLTRPHEIDKARMVYKSYKNTGWLLNTSVLGLQQEDWPITLEGR